MTYNLHAIIDWTSFFIIGLFGFFFVLYGAKYQFIASKLSKKTLQDYVDSEENQEKRYHLDKILDKFMKSFISFESAMVIFFIYKVIIFKGVI